MISRHNKSKTPSPADQKTVSQAYAELKKNETNTSPYIKIPEIRATLFVALSIFIMAYSSLLGMVPILIFYAIWFPYIFYKKQFNARPSKDILVPMLFLGLCLTSVACSDFRPETLRASLEFISMVVCTVVIARLVSVESFIKGTIIGCSIVLIATLLNGTYGRDYFSGTYSLIGLFGSKNQVGFIAEIGLYTTFIYLCTKRNRIAKAVFSVAPLLICLACLILSKSGASIISLAATFTLVISIYCLTKMGSRVRKPALIVCSVFASCIIIGGVYFGIHEWALHIFGKDATLTGRTYLWAQGFKVGMMDPILGHGYAAFWVVGQPLAEKYWYEFMIYSRTGFHFHNLFIQSFVDLGTLGLILISILIISNFSKSFSYIFKNGPSLFSFFALGISFLLLMRAFVEVDFWGPFGIGPLLFFYISTIFSSQQIRCAPRPGYPYT